MRPKRLYLKLFFALAILTATSSYGQLSMDNYIVKVKTAQPYKALSTGTNITSGVVWDEENFKIPLGFTLNIGGKSTNYFCISAGYGFSPGSDTSGIVNTVMSLSGLDMIDRGGISGVASSPLRYTMSGTTPNRIFKFEFFNAGFYAEMDLYSTMDDSINVQVWAYETSNIIEVHYGSSKISHPADYYVFGNSPLVGYIKDFDLDMDTFNKAYTLTGSPSIPTVDSATSLSSTPNVLDNYPDFGTVYRFIPKAVAASIGETTIAQHFNVYPTVAINSIHIDYNQSAKATIELFESNGKFIKNDIIGHGANTIDVSMLATGNYVLKISNDEGKATYKFVKQ